MVNTTVVNGIEMDWFSFGSGEKNLVIIPGLSMKSVMLLEPAVVSMYKDLTDTYTVYMVDRRKNSPPGFLIRDMADDTAMVLKEIGVEKADFFGVSQGGMMAQFIAIDFPEMVNSIVLGSTLSRENDFFKAVMKGWLDLAEAHRAYELTDSVVKGVHSETVYEQYRRMFLAGSDDLTNAEMDDFAQGIKSFSGFNAYDELEKINCPVLVIGSWGDKVVTPESSCEIAEKLGCDIYMYGKEYGHGVYDEAPDYVKRIKNWFNRSEK